MLSKLETSSIHLAMIQSNNTVSFKILQFNFSGQIQYLYVIHTSVTA